MPHHSHPPSFLILILHRLPKNQVVKTCSCGILQTGCPDHGHGMGNLGLHLPAENSPAPAYKVSRFVRFFRSLAARPRCLLRPRKKLGDADSSKKLGASAAEPGVLWPAVAAAEGERRARSSAGLGGAAPRARAARPDRQGRGPR